jgi:hypothetical protein
MNDNDRILNSINLGSSLAAIVTDKLAMDVIATAMSNESWSPDTLDIIADVVRKTGRVISEPETT